MLILERPWTRQPPAPAWTPLARSALNAIYTGGGVMYGSNGGPLPQTLASTTRAFLDGIYLNGRADGDATRLGRWTVGKQPSSIQSLCLAFDFIRTAATANSGFLFSFGDSDVSSRNYVSVTNTALVVSVRETIFGTPRTETYGLTAGVRQKCAIRAVGGVGIEVFINGVLQTPSSATGTMPASIYAAAGYNIVLGGLDDFSAFGALFGYGFWLRDLGSATVRALSVDFHSMMHSPRRIYIPQATAAATAPTITALSAISITATSAQPQITYA